MRLAARLAWRDLAAHGLQAAALASVFAIAVAAFVALGGYRRALATDYRPEKGNVLIVQETQTFAEFYGSRLSPMVLATLKRLGIGAAVAEIHEVVGTSLQDAVLLKGVDLDHYQALDSFVVREGRALRSGDGPRRAMIGLRLAQRLGVAPGGTIRLRGRPFEVAGVFETGSYAENEAWVPLAGAQELLGWGEDVSLYVVPDDGILSVGQQLLDGVSVARRGELWTTFPQQWAGMMTLVGAVTQAIGLAAALSLAAMLWRLAWRRRWQIAVLRSLGFGRGIFSMYLVVQGSSIVAAGGAAGIMA
ncbi:MAG TPA: ABC transporter permease, partial [Anaerolineales bacterium]|nr:ABC transporter permease [Anaerolineales bacterium]